MKNKITETHDWVRLAITDEEKRLSLTASRNGVSTSARGVETPDQHMAMWAFDEIVNAEGAGTYGTRMNKLGIIANKAVSIERFIGQITKQAEKVAGMACPYTSAADQAKSALAIAQRNADRTGVK